MGKQMTLKLGIVPVKRGPWFTSIENALISRRKLLLPLKRSRAT